MMTMNESAKNDLCGYIKKTLCSAAVVHLLLLSAIIGAVIFNATEFLNPLYGGIVGAASATANLFAIGYAYFILAIKGGKRRVLMWPIASFLGMCYLAYGLVVFRPSFIFGFAIGITVPVLFGGAVVCLEKTTPLDPKTK